MRSAPPVVFPVGRFVWRRPEVLLLLVFLSVWIWQPWRAQMPDGLVLWGSLGLQFGLLCWLGWLIWRPIHDVRHLHWDGERWHCETASGQSISTVLEVHADLQRCLWLAVKFTDAPLGPRHHRLWICAFASTKPSAWHGFRCAVYCRAQRSVGAASTSG